MLLSWYLLRWHQIYLPLLLHNQCLCLIQWKRQTRSQNCYENSFDLEKSLVRTQKFQISMNHTLRMAAQRVNIPQDMEETANTTPFSFYPNLSWNILITKFLNFKAHIYSIISFKLKWIARSTSKHFSKTLSKYILRIEMGWNINKEVNVFQIGNSQLLHILYILDLIMGIIFLPSFISSSFFFFLNKRAHKE